MTTMRMRFLIVAASLALAACDRGPVFETSSLTAYQRSYDAIIAKLGLAERQRLEVALMTLAVGNAARSDALVLTDPDRFVNVVTLSDGVANPLMILDRLRPGIQGKTAAEVIDGVAADLDDAISRGQTADGGADKVLRAVQIENARYYWDSRKELPTIVFSIYNGSNSVISRIFVGGVLSDRGRKEKWTTGGFRYAFDPALQPGAQTSVTLVATNFSSQTGRDLQSLYDADVDLKLTNVVTMSGDKLAPLDKDAVDMMRAKRKFLRG